MAKKRQKFKKYSRETKTEVLRKYFEENISSRALGEEYQISQNTIETWVYKIQKEKIFSQTKGNLAAEDQKRKKVI